MNEYFWIIPAYNPGCKIIDVVNGLKAKSPYPIVVVNDGSDDKDSLTYLEKLASDPRIIYLSHSKNKGKGAALKTAFSYLLTNYKTLKGAVTLDADGQHLIGDCLKIMDKLQEELKKNEKVLILGVRYFSRGEVPWKSYLGNQISRLFYGIFLGRFFQDTQTGLRGVSRSLMEDSLQLKAKRFDFETEQLVMAVEENYLIEEENIETVYLDGNKRSSFRPFLDSARIYFVFLRYSLTSFLTFLVDFSVFSLLVFSSAGIYTANLIARFAGLTFQFVVSRNWVFKSDVKYRRYFFFIFYVFLTGLISSFLQERVHFLLGWGKFISKIVVEFILFWWNFFFLRHIVF